jgi:acyl-coenzyme A thioesterase PaaI-like protein
MANLEKEREVKRKLKPVLDHHPYITIEFDEEGFRTVMDNFRPNLLGNFAGGDMAYVANAAAALLCVVEDRVSETASINVECIERADGDKLLARARIVKSGRKLVRLRVDVHVRNERGEKLVAIAQVNMSPVKSSIIEKRTR